ncbi:hypothetical protein [uncultured Serinicoccus sp.]|uniref:hypothetical protein n=1 Tax=uncultured Serinicoccus sp. TaxID=735514 RepID=UPI00260EDAC8|nr:hypothetical protein [uncultured Serinicoccus sp.]
MTPDVLPSWRAGASRDAVVRFLDEARAVPVEDRVACFDNDGTLWCERPRYAQLDFFVDALRTAVARDPGLAERAEYAALLTGDRAARDERGSGGSPWRSPSSSRGSPPRSSRPGCATSSTGPSTPPRTGRCAR